MLSLTLARLDEVTQDMLGDAVVVCVGGGREGRGACVWRRGGGGGGGVCGKHLSCGEFDLGDTSVK